MSVIVCLLGEYKSAVSDHDGCEVNNIFVGIGHLFFLTNRKKSGENSGSVAEEECSPDSPSGQIRSNLKPCERDIVLQ